MAPALSEALPHWSELGPSSDATDVTSSMKVGKLTRGYSPSSRKTHGRPCGGSCPASLSQVPPQYLALLWQSSETLQPISKALGAVGGRDLKDGRALSRTKASSFATPAGRHLRGSEREGTCLEPHSTSRCSAALVAAKPSLSGVQAPAVQKGTEQRKANPPSCP